MTNVFNYLRPGYRPFTSCWWREVFSFRVFRVFKWAYQRVVRGWADCDVWSIDSHLSDIILPMVRQLQNGHGYPCEMEGETKEEKVANWNGILESIAVGFEAVRKMDDVPDEFVTILPKTSQSANYRGTNREYDWEGIQAYQVNQQQIFYNGFYLFEKYFRNLWD